MQISGDSTGMSVGTAVASGGVVGMTASVGSIVGVASGAAQAAATSTRMVITAKIFQNFNILSSYLFQCVNFIDLERSWFQLQPPPLKFTVTKVHCLDKYQNPHNHRNDLYRNTSIAGKVREVKVNLEYFCSIHSAGWDEVDFIE
jgi:hypothetical protein